MVRLDIIRLIFLAVILSSCGYLRDEFGDKDVYVPDIELKCSLDATEFSKIFRQDISGQIVCLKENLFQYAKYVKRESRDFIRKDELKLFVQRFFPENMNQIEPALNLFFSMNLLFLGDEPDQLAIKNITPFIDLILSVNRNVIQVNNLLNKTNSSNYIANRNQTDVIIKEISRELSTIIKNNRSKVFRTLDLNDLLGDVVELLRSFDHKNESIFNMIKMVKNAGSWQFLKKMIIGGEKDVVSISEIDILLSKLPGIVKLTYDLFFSPKRDSRDGNNLVEFYSSMIEQFKQLMSKGADCDVLLEFDSLLTIATELFEESEDWNEIYDQVKFFFQIKEAILGGMSHSVTREELEAIFTYTKIGMNIFAAYDDIKTAKNSNRSENYKTFRKFLNRKIIDLISRSSTILGEIKKFSPIDLGHLLNLVISRFDVKALYGLDEIILLGKRLLAGGEKGILKFNELKLLLPKVNEIILLFFDKSEMGGDAVVFWRDYVKRIKKIIYSFSDDEIVFSLDEFVKVADFAMGHKYNISGFRENVISVKSKIIGGLPEQFSFFDIKKIFSFFYDVTERIIFNSFNYDRLQEKFAIPRRIRRLDGPWEVDVLGDLSAVKLDRLRSDFIHLARRLKLYRNDDGFQYFSGKRTRTKDGFVEASVIEWGLGKFIVAYGHPASTTDSEMKKCKRYKLFKKRTCENGKECIDYSEFRKKNNLTSLKLNGEYFVNSCELGLFLYEYKPLLQQFNLWTSKPNTFASNTIMLADLFQSNSNGDGKVNLMEMVEYTSLIMTAVKISGEIMDGLSKKCPNAGNDKMEFEVKCYRENLFQVMFEMDGYADYFSNLYNYVTSHGKNELEQFLVDIEIFARDFPDDDVPVNGRDITLILGSILNIESIIVRFDSNKNNKLDPSEVKRSFRLFNDFIVEIGNLKGSKVKYAESAYLYMVKNQKIPSPFPLAIFHYFYSKDVLAERSNIASLLSFCVQMSKKENQ